MSKNLKYLKVDFNKKIKNMPIIDFLEALINSMKNQDYEIIHIDQLIELRNKIKRDKI